MDGNEISRMIAEGARDGIVEDAKTIAQKYGGNSVIILVTQYDSEIKKTKLISGRFGDFYASYGAAKQWIIGQDAMEQEAARRGMERDDG